MGRGRRLQRFVLNVFKGARAFVLFKPIRNGFHPRNKKEKEKKKKEKKKRERKI